MTSKEKYSASVIVPARDEAGTISEVVKGVPLIGKSAELIFVEGYSKDDSWEQIKRVVKRGKKGLVVRAFKYNGKKGKAAAVWYGIEKARGNIIIILDADLSVSPNELTKFYTKLALNGTDFVNGSRFLIPKEKGAMKYFNHLGNKFFAWAFSMLMKHKITDTLCGTKAFFRKDFFRMKKMLLPSIFEDDPYGDFTLLFGAKALDLGIKEVPVAYKARIYGKSKTSILKDGPKLFSILFKDIFSLYLRTTD